MNINNIETLENIKELVRNSSLRELFVEAFGKRKAKTMLNGTKSNGYVYDTTNYALMVNLNTDKLFVLNYATPDNNWADVAMQQNYNWYLIDYISAEDIAEDFAKDYLEQRIDENIYRLELIENFQNKY